MPGAPLVILLHGFPDFWWSWRHQIAALAAGAHVVVPDLRGYNLSDAPRGIENYRLNLIAGDILRLADSYEGGAFHVVGHDWGGIVAWAVATRAPHRTSTLTVIDAPHPDTLGLTALLRHPLQTVRSSYAAFFQLPSVPETMLSCFGYALLRGALASSDGRSLLGERHRRDYVRAWSRPGRLTAMLNYYRALPRYPHPAPVGRTEVNTLILWGSADPYLGLHLAQQALGLCSRGRLCIVEGTGHWPHIERPDEITAALLEFIAT